jgi:hypothetical protein
MNSVVSITIAWNIHFCVWNILMHRMLVWSREYTACHFFWTLLVTEIIRTHTYIYIYTHTHTLKCYHSATKSIFMNFTQHLSVYWFLLFQNNIYFVMDSNGGLLFIHSGFINFLVRLLRAKKNKCYSITFDIYVMVTVCTRAKIILF